METKKEICALTKLSNGVQIVKPSIFYQCPYCKKEMGTEYNFDDSQEYIYCLKCKKAFTLVLKEVDKEFKEKYSQK